MLQAAQLLAELLGVQPDPGRELRYFTIVQVQAHDVGYVFGPVVGDAEAAHVRDGLPAH
ncbi:hypothetical protein ACIHCQ_27365 [Streptomyces sp. NPDC052236]|uniref:hypothetical protein n=1 Tax=Streptomyces sp. NPDC052236 TaxID=3365686 RepID=UPI0037D8917E